MGDYEIISKRITEDIQDLYIVHEKAIREEGISASEYGILLYYLENPKTLRIRSLRNYLGNVIGRVNEYTIIKLSINTDISSIFDKYGENIIVCWDIKSTYDASFVGNIIRDNNLQFSYNIHFACIKENGRRRGTIRVYAFYKR
jgi:hypothetical protein